MDLRKTEEEIDKEVRKLRLEDRKRYLFWEFPPPDPIDRIDLERIATGLLGIQLLPAREFQIEESFYKGGNLPSRVAAVLNRSEGTIRVVRRRFRKETQRFTLALAIAHWVLHPRYGMLKLAPSMAGHWPGALKPKEEEEAELFAEELLMPKKLVRAYFQEVFERPTLRDEPLTDVYARWLGRGVEYEVPTMSILEQGRRRLAGLAAECVAEGRDVRSMATRFRVSCLAMAIRLERLSLI